VRIDIHNRERRLERLLERIQKSPELRDTNREAILWFYHNCSAQGLSVGRIEKLLATLFQMALTLRKPFVNCNKQDIFQLVEEISRKNWSEWTKHDYKVRLKKFFKWLRQTNDYPEEVAWFSTNIARSRTILPESLPTAKTSARWLQLQITRGTKPSFLFLARLADE